MKRLIYILFLGLFICLTSCENAETTKEVVASENTINDEITEVTTSEEVLESEGEVQTADVEETAEVIDLSVMNATMAYSALVNIYNNADNYFGDVIKIKGEFAAYGSSTSDTTYFYVLVYDEVMCCQAGVEFIWDNNSHLYPDEYPEEGAEIEIEGVFSSYEESGEEYYYVSVASIEKV